MKTKKIATLAITVLAVAIFATAAYCFLGGADPSRNMGNYRSFSFYADRPGNAAAAWMQPGSAPPKPWDEFWFDNSGNFELPAGLKLPGPVSIGTTYLTANDLATLTTDATLTGESVEVTNSVTLTGSLTINCALRIDNGAIITVPSGDTLTVDGPFHAGPYQCFDANNGSASSPAVVFGPQSTPRVYVDWFGANTAPRTTDMGPAINAAANSARTHAIPVKFGTASPYYTTESLNFTSANDLLGTADSWDISGVSTGSQSTEIEGNISGAYPIVDMSLDQTPCIRSITIQGDSSTASITTAGSGYATADDLLVTGGSGSGALLNVTAASGAITAVSFAVNGTGYVAGDVLTVVQSGGSGGTVTITSVGGEQTCGVLWGANATHRAYGIQLGPDLEIGGNFSVAAFINIGGDHGHTLGYCRLYGPIGALISTNTSPEGGVIKSEYAATLANGPGSVTQFYVGSSAFIVGNGGDPNGWGAAVDFDGVPGQLQINQAYLAQNNGGNACIAVTNSDSQTVIPSVHYSQTRCENQSIEPGRFLYLDDTHGLTNSSFSGFAGGGSTPGALFYLNNGSIYSSHINLYTMGTYNGGHIVEDSASNTTGEIANSEIGSLTGGLALGPFYSGTDAALLGGCRIYLYSWQPGWADAFAGGNSIIVGHGGASQERGTLPQIFSVTNLTALAGGGRSSTTFLTPGLNRITTVATAGDSVTLPSGFMGEEVIISNGGANSLDVYTNTSSETFDDGASSETVAADTTVRFIRVSATKWSTPF